MIKRLKPAILLLLFILNPQNADSQVQKDLSEYLKARFQKYTEFIPREEIYVHTDRESYVAGEDLWFNIYLINRKNFSPSDNSTIAYFELLNIENRPVLQKRILLDKGFGPGQVLIPDTISSGVYTIRAYTSWMKNFLPENCFMKEIRIYNAFQKKVFKTKVYSEGIRFDGAGSLNPGGNSGIVLQVNNSSDILEIILTADAKYRSENGNRFYLFVQTHGKIDYSDFEFITEDSKKIRIPKKSLSAGINQITVFSSNGQPVCEKYAFTPVEERAVSIIASDSARLRSLISVDMKMEGGLPAVKNKTNLSISVAPVCSVNQAAGLSDYLIFGSEFGANPGRILRGRKPGEIPAEALDSILLSIKSNWIDWNAILSDKLPVLEFEPEKKYHFLPGRMITPDQKAPASAEFVLMSIPGKIATFQYAKTDQNGNFRFKIPVDEEIHDLIIQQDYVINKNKIIIESSFSDQYQMSEVKPDPGNKDISADIVSMGINYQVNKIYESPSYGQPILRTFRKPVIKRFYGKPDIEILMDDYIKLPVMQEVFFELFPGIVLRSRKSQYEFSIMDPFENKFYDKPPVLMIDGVVINDPSAIVNLDPENVEKIDALKEKYFVGDYLFYGLINVTTKAGNFSNANIPDLAVRIPYRVVEPVSSFKSKDYSSSESKSAHLPDFRNTLYWNPSIIPDKDGNAGIKLWSSDIISEYLISIQGFDSQGKVVSVNKRIRVN